MKSLITLATAGLFALSLVLMSPAGAEAGKAKKKKKNSADTAFKTLDANNDGKVSKEEFAKVSELGKKKKQIKAKKLDKMFAQLDTNSDGTLSSDELKKLGDLKGKKKKAKSNQ